MDIFSEAVGAITNGKTAVSERKAETLSRNAELCEQ